MKVIQKMQSGGRKLSQEELEAAIREIEEQGTVFGKGSGLSKDQTKKYYNQNNIIKGDC